MEVVRRTVNGFLKVKHLQPSVRGFMLYAEFSDGSAGEVDCSQLASLAVFADWRQGGFGDVWLDDGIPCWGEDSHLSPDWLKRRLRPKTLQEWEKEQQQQAVMAGQ